MTGEQETTALGSRRLQVGAEAVDGGTYFRVWAPERSRVEVLIDGRSHALRREASGYFEALVEDAGPGARYTYRLDAHGAFPDPASRFQPDGVHGPSQVVD